MCELARKATSVSGRAGRAGDAALIVSGVDRASREARSDATNFFLVGPAWHPLVEVRPTSDAERAELFAEATCRVVHHPFYKFAAA